MDKPLLIADENVHNRIILDLRAKGYTVYSIREKTPGITDSEVLSISEKQGGILITEDADFGELVYSHRKKAIGILFLRYSWKDLEAICLAITKVLNAYRLNGMFCTVTCKKVRIRALPE